MNKKGQIFLLAAVIISVIVLSLGVTTNRAVVNSEPEKFYKFSYEVKREASASLDYEIYTNISSTGVGSLDDFASSLIDEIKDKEPDANFMIIYGSNVDGFTIKSVWRGTGSPSVIDYGGGHINIRQSVGISERSIPVADLTSTSEFTAEINGQDFEFPITQYQQVIFIIQKDVEDEVYVAVQ